MPRSATVRLWLVTALLWLVAAAADDPSAHRIPTRLAGASAYRTRNMPAPSVQAAEAEREAEGLEPDHVVAVRLRPGALDDVYASDRDEERYSPVGVGRALGRLRDIALGHGFHYVRAIAGLPGVHLFRRDGALRDVAHGLEDSADVEWFEDVRTPPARVKRDGPHQDLRIDDPLWSRQWYMADADTVSSTSSGHAQWGHPLHINVVPAWESGVQGASTTVAIVDDGLERRHPDLNGNYRADLSYDVNNGNANPTPDRNNYHGTACAGIACAVGMNAEGIVGVAYRAGLAGIKVLERRASDADEAEALSLACTAEGYARHHARFINSSRADVAREAQDRALRAVQPDPRTGQRRTTATNHIFSCSWGPVDDGRHLDGPGTLVREAYAHCTQQGRGGLGSIYIVAGGNGRDYYDTSNYDGYANADETIAVAAVTDYGAFAWYSEPGANLLCALPSSGNGQRAIAATDLTGDDGATPGDYTQTFGGTSADAPMLAGVVALMLDANPALTWRDVQHVLIRACRVPQTRTAIWSMNSAGRLHSMDYGFGVPDASHAVALAQQWGGRGPQSEGAEVRGPRVRAFSGQLTPGGGGRHHHGGDSSTWNIERSHSLTLKWDFSEAARASTVEVTRRPGRTAEPGAADHTALLDRDAGVALRLEHVRVYIEADTPMGHGYFGATLCGPSGVCSPLAISGRGQDSSVSWSYSTLRHWDEPAVYIPDLDQRPDDIRSQAAPTDPANFGVWELRMGNLYAYRSDPIRIHSWALEFHGTVHQL